MFPREIKYALLLYMFQMIAAAGLVYREQQDLTHVVSKLARMEEEVASFVSPEKLAMMKKTTPEDEIVIERPKYKNVIPGLK